MAAVEGYQTALVSVYSCKKFEMRCQDFNILPSAAASDAKPRPEEESLKLRRTSRIRKSRGDELCLRGGSDQHALHALHQSAVVVLERNGS